jgi:hypothetical protein
LGGELGGLRPALPLGAVEQALNRMAPAMMIMVFIRFPCVVPAVFEPGDREMFKIVRRWANPEPARVRSIGATKR